MKCNECGKNVVTFKKVVDNVKTHVCFDCLRKTNPDSIGFSTPLQNIYYMKWRLVDQEGKEWIEEFDEVSLSDIEMIWDNNVYGIVWQTTRMKGRSMI